MISNISNIIPVPGSSTSQSGSRPSSGPTPAAANSTDQAVVDKTAVAQSTASNGGPKIANAGLLNEAVDYLNAKIQNLNRNLEFSLDQQSGDVLVKVVDAHTHELIRQIPSEEALALARDIQRYMQDHPVGLLSQVKA